MRGVGAGHVVSLSFFFLLLLLLLLLFFIIIIIRVVVVPISVSVSVHKAQYQCATHVRFPSVSMRSRTFHRIRTVRTPLHHAYHWCSV